MTPVNILSFPSPSHLNNHHKQLKFLKLHQAPPNPKLSEPISEHTIRTTLNAPKTDLTSVLSKKIAFLVFGTLFFTGCFKSKPSFALSDRFVSIEEKLVESEPRNVEALKVLVYKKMRGGMMEDAVEYVKRLIEIEPEEVEWGLLLALCYENSGVLCTAEELFRGILKEKPLLLKALHGLAMVMHKKNEGPAVFEMLDQALEVARSKRMVSEERNIKILIAQMHVVKGELEDGLKIFQALIDENPRDFRPYLCRGIIYSLLDKKNEASEQFEIYRSLVPEEFPERGFLDDVVLAAKTKPGEHLQKEFQAEFSYNK